MIPESTCPPPDVARLVRTSGWAVTTPVVTLASLAVVATELASLPSGVERGGARNVLDLPAARELARSSAVRLKVEAALGPSCLAVRGLLFDKTSAANWKVPWHQDLTVAVRERRERPGFGPWSVKAGVPHAQAPAEILEGMLAVRVHLDDCGPNNGPLRVLPGSHLGGKLGAAEREAWQTRVTPTECIALRGAIVFMRPLLLHASRPAASPGARRVVNLEFAAGPLPAGLRWHWAVRAPPPVVVNILPVA